MKILTAQEMRAADRATFDQIGVPSRAVMEVAGRSVAQALLEYYPDMRTAPPLVVAGGGNNGGDAFVVARALQNLKVSLNLFALKPLKSLSGDAGSAASAFELSGGKIFLLTEENLTESFEAFYGTPTSFILDGIFGTGFHGPATGLAARAIDAMNVLSENSSIPVVSIDLPSGCETDSGRILGSAVLADRTITLQCLKPAIVLSPGAELCGDVSVVDIGIPIALPEIVQCPRTFLLPEDIQEILSESPLLLSTAHKGTRGHTFVIGGSEGKFGAPRLSAEAALRVGSGLATLALPGFSQMQVCPPELMTDVFPEQDGAFASLTRDELFRRIAGKDALVVGPGLGQSAGAKSLFCTLISLNEEEIPPMVLDADALNLLSELPDEKRKFAGSVVLTPHPGEMARLLHCSVQDVQEDRFRAAVEAAKRYHAHIVLKGVRTVIAAPNGELWVNPFANSVLATGGSGDVLAGVIGGFLAQSFSVQDASCLGVYLHGLGGELLCRENDGPFGVIAGDILRAIPEAMNLFLAEEKFSVSAHHGFLRQVLPANSLFAD